MITSKTLKQQWGTRWWLSAIIAEIMKFILFRELYNKAIESDLGPLKENTLKHLACLYNCIPIIPLTVIAMIYGGEKAAQIVLYISLAAQVAGLAWFVISFAALPMRHNAGAMVITKNMFSAFLATIFSITTLSAFQAPLTLPIIVMIYWWLYKASAGYDSADLLKMGKDEEELLAAKSTQRIEKLLEQIRDSLVKTP